MRNTYERLIPEFNDPISFNRHKVRYDFAMPYVAGKRVLDVACGVGYGTNLLSKVASLVVGAELDLESLKFGREKYMNEKVRFVTADCRKLPFRTGQFGAICSFETIEHIIEQDEFLSEAARVLSEDGALIISTTNKKTYTFKNEFHVRELDKDEFLEVLSRHFNKIEIWGQHYIGRYSWLKSGIDLQRKLPKVLRLPLKFVASKMSFLSDSKEVFGFSKENVDKSTNFVSVCTQPKKR